VLEEIFHQLNERHFGSSLPQPKLLWNSRLRSSAGRFCPGSRNPLKPKLAEIEVATYLKEHVDSAIHITDTLLHEMVHYYLWFQKKPYGHTPEFHQILKRVGARRYNPIPKLSPVKYLYECRQCRKKIPARRKLRPSACADCCKSYNRGYFSEKYLLVLCSEQQMKLAKPMEEFIPSKPEEVIQKLQTLKQIILGLRK
jgi:predicted SprT family Zn-dependent metalloprotease